MKPYAWINVNDEYKILFDDELPTYYPQAWIPLYTHPAKKQKCVVQDCENHQHEGSFNGDLCSPCFQFIAHGKGTNSQAYSNAHPAKTLTDEEIMELSYLTSDNDPLDFARAILRKAQE